MAVQVVVLVGSDRFASKIVLKAKTLLVVEAEVQELNGFFFCCPFGRDCIFERQRMVMEAVAVEEVVVMVAV